MAAAITLGSEPENVITCLYMYKLARGVGSMLCKYIQYITTTYVQLYESYFDELIAEFRSDNRRTPIKALKTNSKLKQFVL